MVLFHSVYNFFFDRCTEIVEWVGAVAMLKSTVLLVDSVTKEPYQVAWKESSTDKLSFLKIVIFNLGSEFNLQCRTLVQIILELELAIMLKNTKIVYLAYTVHSVEKLFSKMLSCGQPKA